MAVRKASAYSKRKVTPFTRISKRRQKSYIKTVPQQKIVKFTMGNLKNYNKGKFPVIIRVIATEDVQIRHMAFEACRQFVNKKLDKQLSGNYLFRVIPFPHHVQRENKMITGAGADRMQTGMQLAYGKVAGKAAIVKKGKTIFLLALPDKNAAMFARGLIKQIKSKLPCKITTREEKFSNKE